VSVRADPSLLLEIQKYGAQDIEACFNCGNCTAVCPLSSSDGSFPRQDIRFAQVGAKDLLLSSKELWLCYYCGECTQTCPRQADPGEFMAAARRFAIANYDVTGVAKRLYKSAWFNVIFTVGLAAFFGLFLLSFNQGEQLSSLALWKFIPELVVRYLGLSVFGIVGLTGALGVLRMIRAISKAGGIGQSGETGGINLGWWQALKATLSEVLGHNNYRTEECEQERKTPWVLRKWFMHATIMYGFLGLFGATALDFLFKPVGSWVPLYYPPRLLGTLAGAALMYGTSLAVVKRLRKTDRSASHSQASDWTFLGLLWLVGLTGFLLEVAVYAPPTAMWGYAMLIVHVSLAMDLIVLLPFIKFAHIVYRTVAIFVHHLKPVEQSAESTMTTATA
jgi:ferredoxin/nitrate reductase gamma subunit